MKQQDHIKELLKLIEENPDLPVVAWVHNEVVGGDCGRWLGYLSKPCVKEFILAEMYGDTPEAVYRDNTAAYEEYLRCEYNMADETITEFINNIQWMKIITVSVDMPDSEFEKRLQFNIEAALKELAADEKEG